MDSKKIIYVFLFAITTLIHASDHDGNDDRDRERREEIERQFQKRIRSEARQDQPTNTAYYDYLNNNTERKPDQNRR